MAGRRGAAVDARGLALRVLEQVDRSGAYADLALRAALDKSRLEPPDRALATELVCGTLRWRGRVVRAHARGVADGPGGARR